MHMYELHEYTMKNRSENQNVTTMTPNDLMLTFYPITQVEGLKLMNMYESYGYAM